MTNYCSRVKRLRALIGWLALAVSGGTTAQVDDEYPWSVVLQTPSGASTPVKVAVVRNGSGHRLHIYLESTGVIRGVLFIGGGLKLLEKRACPTIQVDNWYPARVRFEGHRCELRPQQAHFSFGELNEKRLYSRGVTQLMNGTRLTFRYRLKGAGYTETQFTLKGSKGALTAVLGNDLEVVNQ